MSNLVWTDERPSKPGWYWVEQSDGRPYVAEVIITGRGVFLWWGEHQWLGIEHQDYKGARWAGPIEPPREAGEED